MMYHSFINHLFMKTILLKTVFILLLSFTLVQNSNAAGRYHYRYCAPRYYEGPRFVRPGYYGPRYVEVAVPYYVRHEVYGHYIIDRCGRRVFVREYYR